MSQMSRDDLREHAARVRPARSSDRMRRRPSRFGSFNENCLKNLKEYEMQALNLETSSSPLAEAAAKIGSPSYQAYGILRFGFTVAPILAGLDKFFGLLVNWDQYLPSFVNNMVGGHGHSLMYLVGVIEVIAGLGVWFKPRIFAYVVAGWLFLIIINLLMIPGFYDVALRDLGLALGALALGRLSQEHSR
jgi:hypothetical protein